MTNASNSNSSKDQAEGARGAIKSRSGDNPSELDLAADIMGDNSLQGDDQDNTVNQRRAVPDAKGETEGVLESFEKLDKDARAERDLGKGNRQQSKPD